MKKMIWLLALAMTLVLYGCEGGGAASGRETAGAETLEASEAVPEEGEPVTEIRNELTEENERAALDEPEGVQVTTAAAWEAAAPEAVDAAMSIVRDTVDVVNSYGVVEVGNKTVDGSSNLSFDFRYESLMTTDEGYIADVILARPIEIPADLQVGDQCTLVTNELTGDSLKIRRTAENEYVKEGGEDWPYYVSAGPDGELLLYEGSDDRVDCPFYQGKLMVRRDAQYSIPIMGEARTITEADFNEFDEGHLWSNGVWFNEAGEVTKICYFGD